MKTNVSKTYSSDADTHGSEPQSLRSHPGGKQFPPGISLWQIERARRLHKVCIGIEKSIRKGHTLRRAMRWSLRTARNQGFYRADASRRIRVSRGTLLRLYYQWKRNGRCQQAFALRYRTPHKFDLSPSQLREFINVASSPTVGNIGTAIDRCARAWQISSRTLLRRLPVALRNDIRQL